MKISRRGFLSMMLASAAAEAVDWEKLLWMPKPIITVPELPFETLDVSRVDIFDAYEYSWKFVADRDEIEEVLDRFREPVYGGLVYHSIGSVYGTQEDANGGDTAGARQLRQPREWHDSPSGLRPGTAVVTSPVHAGGKTHLRWRAGD